VQNNFTAEATYAAISIIRLAFDELTPGNFASEEMLGDGVFDDHKKQAIRHTISEQFDWDSSFADLMGAKLILPMIKSIAAMNALNDQILFVTPDIVTVSFEHDRASDTVTGVAICPLFVRDVKTITVNK